MSGMVVHGVPGSPYGRAVLATLEEKRTPWRLVAVQPGGLRAGPHIGRHPFGRVPVLEHDGFRLYETQAILRYLDRVLPEPSLTPVDPREAAAMDLAMAVNDWYLFQGPGGVIAFQRVVAPKVMGAAADETAIAAVMPQARIVFAELGRLLDDKPFLAGRSLTLADLLVGAQCAMIAEAPEWALLTDCHPNLQAWLDRLQRRPSFRATTWDATVAAARI